MNDGATLALRPPGVAAMDIPVFDNEADQELHPPYEREAQVVSNDVPNRHTTGGRMQQGAHREARDQTPMGPA